MWCPAPPPWTPKTWPRWGICISINEALTFGIGLNAPVGFLQNTPVDWSGKYQTTGTFIITQNLGLSLGWEVTPDFRLGAGVDIQYLFFNIKNQVDTGTRIEDQFDIDCPQIVNTTSSDVLNGLLGGLGSGLTASLGAAGNVLITGLPADEVICGDANTRGLIEPTGLAGEFDFDNEFELHDVGFGYNIGFQWDITESTMLGVHFRSKVNHSLTGEAERDNGGNLQYARRLQNEADGAGEQLLLSLREPLTGFSAGETYPSLVTLKALQNTNDQSVRADLTIPETINIGLQHQLSPRLKVALNYVWTNWSRFDELEFFYTGQPRFFDDVFRQVIGRELRPNERVDRRDNPTFQPLNFEDAARYGIGADYRWSEELNLRSGFAYVEPVIDADTTTDRIRAPIDHTYVFTVGATWRMDPQTSIDVAAAYTLISDGAIRQRNIASRTGNKLRGSFSDVHIYVAGLTLRHRFE